MSEADAELTRACAHRKRQHAGDADDRDRQRHEREAAEDERVQSIGCEHLGAYVLQGCRPFDRLLRRHLANDARNRRHQRVRILHARAYEQPAADPRAIDRHHRPRHDVLVVDVRGDAHDAPRFAADAAELQEVRLGPHEPAVKGGLDAREHPLRQALTDDDQIVAVARVVVSEIAAGNDRHIQRCKKSRRRSAPAGPRIFLTVRPREPFDRELSAERLTEPIPPGHRRSERHAIDAGQLLDLPHDVLVERDSLIRRPAVGDHRHVHREHLPRLEAGRRALQRDERRQQHAGAREQHERRGDLRDGKQPEAAVRARRDAHASVGESKAAGGVGRRQARHEREQHRCGQGQAHADPQQACVDGQVEGANREAGRISAEDWHYPQRDDHTENRPDAAEQQAFREQRSAQRARTGAERRPYGQLAFPPDRSGQDQVRDVGARDDEDQRRRGQQDEEHRSRPRCDLIPQQLRVDPEVGLRRVRLGVFLEDGAVDGAQLGARRLEIRAGRKAAEQFRHPMGAARHHRCRQVVRARDDVRDDLGFGRIGHRWFEDADDRR